MADGQVADGYLPSSIKELVKYGVSGLALLWAARKFAPKQAYKFGIQEVPPGIVIGFDTNGSPVLGKAP